jgi:hypothetical protein
MIKHLIAIVLFSILVILFMPQAQIAIKGLLAAHDWVANVLKDVFSDGPSGNLIRELIASLTVPFVVALLPAAIYWMVKRHWFPYFMPIAWVLWLIQTSALVIEYKAAVV